MDTLYKAAKDVIETRFKLDEPWMGAAAVETDTGKILTSTGFQFTPNESARLCHETGAICECFKLNERIVKCLCISRNDQGVYEVLPPCGICQERLFYWGGDIQVAVPTLPDTTQFKYVTLDEVSPFYWFKPYRNTV